MAEIQFQSGIFQKFKALVSVHLGAYQFDLAKGTIVEFDGQVARISGREWVLPALTQAIVKMKWLVPLEDNSTRYAPQPAGISVRPAQSAGSDRGEPIKIEAATDDEEVVSNVDEANARRALALKNSSERTMASAPEPPPAPKAPRPEPRPIPQAAPPVTITTTAEEPVEVTYDTGDDYDGGSQEGVVVSKIGGGGGAVVRREGDTKTTKTIRLTDSRQVDAELRKLESAGPVKVQRMKKSTSKINADAEAGIPIGQTLPGGATGDVSVARAGDDLADLLPDAASSGRPAASVTTNPVEVNWDMSPHWRTRVKKALELYANKPTLMKQVYAVEVDSVIKHIKQELAKG